MCRCMEFFDERLGCAKDKCKVVAVTCDGGAEPCCQGAGELGSLSVLEGAQRPNLKSEDSGFRHRFSEAKVS